MAVNTNKKYRIAEVKSKAQVFNPKTGKWQKRDKLGRFATVKNSGEPFKGITKEGVKQLEELLLQLHHYDKQK